VPDFLRIIRLNIGLLLALVLLACSANPSVGTLPPTVADNGNSQIERCPPHSGLAFATPEKYYTDESRRQREEGVCKVAAIIDKGGVARSITLTTATAYQRLNDSCLKAVKEHRFPPVIINGSPVACTVEISLTWRLN
jgi:TonB family protein